MHAGRSLIKRILMIIDWIHTADGWLQIPVEPRRRGIGRQWWTTDQGAKTLSRERGLPQMKQIQKHWSGPLLFKDVLLGFDHRAHDAGSPLPPPHPNVSPCVCCLSTSGLNSPFVSLLLYPHFLLLFSTSTWGNVHRHSTGCLHV